MAMLTHDREVKSGVHLDMSLSFALQIFNSGPQSTSLHASPLSTHHALLGTDNMPNAVLGTGGTAARETLELLFP